MVGPFQFSFVMPRQLFLNSLNRSDNVVSMPGALSAMSSGALMPIQFATLLNFFFSIGGKKKSGTLIWVHHDPLKFTSVPNHMDMQCFTKLQRNSAN